VACPVWVAWVVCPVVCPVLCPVVDLAASLVLVVLVALLAMMTAQLSKVSLSQNMNSSLQDLEYILTNRQRLTRLLNCGFSLLRRYLAQWR